jgi:serine/threonine protein kinase
LGHLKNKSQTREILTGFFFSLLGFTHDNRVKLFDFGLAKELDPKQKVSEVSPLFHMSGGTGSRRYMAPEVHSDEPYGLSADLYSFSIVLWEILTCQKAFGKLSTDAHKDLVIEGTLRPEMDPSWRPSLVKIFTQCWCRNPLDRWSAGQAYNALRKEIHELVKQEFPAQAATEERRRIAV